MRSLRRRRQLGHLLTYAALALMSVLFMLPFAWMLRSSLMSLGQIFVIPIQWIPHPLRLRNYVEALTVLPFGRYALNTLLLVFVGVPGIVLTSSLAAYSFARLAWPGRSVFFALIMSTMMLPGAVTLIPTFLGWRYVAGVDNYLPLMVPHWFGGGAFNIFLLRQFMFGIPRELEEAGKMDGARYWSLYARVVAPLSASALVVVGLLSFFGIWNDYFGPLIYLNKQQLFTLALGLTQFVGMYSAQWHRLMAAATVVVVPPVVLFFVGQRHLVESITLTGLKG